MNPTHDPDNAAQQSRRDTDGPAAWLAGLLTDANRFRAHVASAMGKAASPVPALEETEPGWRVAEGRSCDPCVELAALAESAGYVLTDAGREALASVTVDFADKAVNAVRHGVTPDQIMTDYWDGEPWFEQIDTWRQHPGSVTPVLDVQCRFVDLFRSAEIAEAWGENELDHDRVPTTGGFEAWCHERAERETSDAGFGYVFTDAGLRALDQIPAAEAPGTVPLVLRSAASYLERYGWIQGAYYDGTTGVFTPPACMVGAIGMACYGGPVDAPAEHRNDPGYADFEQAVLHLDRYLLVEDGSESYEFNDARGRRLEDVTRVLRDAATRPAEELVDAIKAIDEMNDRLAESGITAEQVIVLLDGGDLQ
ncbi:DUF6197 family protein [Actinoplanes aureus]|uniref:Uncharacterized protein n=1 Tax=Actinoplanes aureus TaxID=2792083 RepID=A0A931G2E4_9ACTN|nr:hypothetical protein [Actinoplanes aureus]MBG0568080.1 hypothetical protein [Actinoplanes aureus]